MKRFSLFLKMLLLLVVGWGAPCAFMRAQVVIEAIGEAIDLAELENGSSTPVVMRAGGDGSYGFVWYKHEGDPLRFVIDTQKPTKADLMGVDDATKYTFVLEKTNDGEIRIRENMKGGYIPQYSGNSRGGFSSVEGSNNLAGFFNYESAIPAANLLSDNHAYYLTPAKLTNPLTVSKNGNYFEVGGTSVRVPLQFFTYHVATNYEVILRNLETLQGNLPALYTPEALTDLQSVLRSSTASDSEKEAAIAAFYASADGKVVAISSRGRGGADTPHYLYSTGTTNISTGVMGSGNKYFFQVETTDAIGAFRLKNMGADGYYLGKTRTNNTPIAAVQNAEDAGIYTFNFNTASTDLKDHINIVCQNKQDGTNTALHEEGGGSYIVSWTTGVGSAASFWTVEVPHSVTVHYQKHDGDIELPDHDTLYYIGEGGTITPTTYDGYDVTPASATIGSGDITFTYSLKTTTPFFEVAKDYDSVEHWYFMSIHGDRYYMQYVDGQTAIPLDAAHRTLPTTEVANSYLWSFVQSGTANRYKIVNKVAGADKVLSNDKTFANDAVGQNVHPLLKNVNSLTENDADRYSVSGSNRIGNANGFFIGCQLTNGSTQYMNRRNGLAYWYGGSDGGSTFIATEASFTTISYVDADGKPLLDEISPILPVGVYTVPTIEGYDYVGYTMDNGARHDGLEPPTLLGGTHTLKLHYAQKNYTVTYNCYMLGEEDAQPHATERYDGLHFGDAFPEPQHKHDGYHLVKIPTGTVIGTRDYRIYCTNDNYEPAPDPELPAVVNIVYDYYYGKNLVMSGKPQEVANGEAMPGLDPLPDFVTCSAPRGTVHYYDTIVHIPLQVTYTVPFKCFESYSSIDEWYNLSISAARNLFKYEAGTDYIQLNESGVKKDDKYLFAFVGDPFNGFRIYNKAAEADKILSSLSPYYKANGGKDTGEDSTPHMVDANNLPEGYNTYWMLKPTGSNFFIRRKDDSNGYINKRNDTGRSGDVLAFWTGGADAGSTVYINMVDLSFGESITQNAVPRGSAPEDGKVYRIYSAYTDRNVAGYMVSEKQPTGEELTHKGTMYLTNTKTVRDRSQMWMAVKQSDTNAFQLINLESGRYMQVGGNTNENAVTVFILPTQANPTTYGICNNAAGKNSLNTNANRPVTSWGWSSNGTDNMGSNWVFEEVDYNVGGEFTKDDLSARVHGFSPYAELVSGKYYRLKNENHTSLYMAENFLSDEKVRAVAENALPNPYAAVWRIDGNSTDGFTFTNALTTHVIAQQTGWNAQYPTNHDAGAAKTFFIVEDGGSSVAPPRYAFCPNPEGGSNPLYSLHCQAGGNVLNWNYRDNSGIATASFWRLEEVEVPSAEELERLYQEILRSNAEVTAINGNRTELSEKLTAYFEDAACTRLQAQYRHISDASLRVIMEDDQLPTALQNIIVSIKDGKWDATKDRAYNEYVGKFRIAEYAPYSDRNAWNSKLRISATCYLTNPTGITVRSGEVVYLFVEDEPKAGAVLNLEIVEDTNAGAAANLGDLHRGLNVFTASATGELFVNYKVADTEKYLRGAKDLSGVWHDPDYLPIKIHIEGGTANGYWDLSRNMTAEDWEWLCNNMFFSDFLHIKGNNTLLCLLTRNCRYADHIVEAMQVYDFIYTQELKYIGHDGQFDGRYHPSVTIRDSYSGLFWNGNSANLAGHGIDYRSLINAGYWGICHEVAHGIQDVFNLAGLTEVTNNALVQMINHDFGVKSSRGISVKALLEYKNNGDTWIDVLRSGNVTWATNHLFFQLYLYFEHAGHMPGFMGRVCDKIREWGGIHQTTQNRVMKYNEDYLMFAKACAEVSQTDLYDFFDAWGFFGYSEDTRSINEQDRKAEHIYYIGDYGSVSLLQPSRENATDRAYVEELKAYMKSRPNKAPNLLFINDRLKHDGWVVSDTCAAAKIDPNIIGQPVGYIDSWEEGDFGMFYDFGADRCGSDIDLQLNERSGVLTVSGEGIVGVKLCDAEGNNRYVYNTRTITLTEEIVRQITSGELTLVVALGDNTDIPFVTEVGDMNHDGRITIADLAILVRALRVTKTGTYRLDQVDELKAKIQQAQYTE